MRVSSRDRLRPGIGVVLFILALIPLAGTTWFATQDVREASEQAASASDIQDTAEHVRHLVTLRAALTDDRIWTYATVAVAELLVAHGVSRKELAAMESLGLLTTVQAGGELRIAAQDAWMIELWGSLRAAGLSRELGFEVEDLGFYEEAISGLLEQEVGLLTPRLAHLPADEVAAIVQRALPLITTFITRYHLTKVRNFFSSLG